MTVLQRLAATWNGRKRDHIPLLVPCAGLEAPAKYSWDGADGSLRTHWYSLHDEGPGGPDWTLDDELRRVEAWAALEVDDIIDIAFPRPEIGELPPLNDPEDADAFAAAFAPTDEEFERYRERMDRVRAFVRETPVPVQVWAAETPEHLIRHLGLEKAIALANEEPAIFSQLMSAATAADEALVEFAATVPGVDLIGIGGRELLPEAWTSLLFDRYTYAYIDAVARAAHKQGVKVSYMAAGNAAIVGSRLVDVAAEALYYVDMQEPPIPEPVRRMPARRRLPENKIAVAGGVPPELLGQAPDTITKEVRKVISAKPWGDRFILSPSAPLGPETPWKGVEALIEAWKDRR